MNYEQMTAPCGLACFNCYLYLANENPTIRTLVAKELGIPEEDAVCRGCRNENGNCKANPLECHVYPCAEEKGLKLCSDCSDFPCDHLQPYADMADKVPHNTKVYNLCLIKKMGLEAWATEKSRIVKETYFKEKLKL